MAEMMIGIGSGEHIPALWGRSLRFVLLDRIRAQNTMTVAEMVAYLASMRSEEPPPTPLLQPDRWEPPWRRYRELLDSRTVEKIESQGVHRADFFC